MARPAKCGSLRQVLNCLARSERKVHTLPWPKHALVAFCWSGALLGCTCSPSSQAVERPADLSAHQAVNTSAAQPVPAGNSHSVASANTDQNANALKATANERPPEARVFPPQLPLDAPVELAMAGDRSLRVSHAPSSQMHPIIYLHGMCGNSKGADLWSNLATQYGTLIVVRADEPCGDRPGYKWPKDLSLIQARIDAALQAVKSERGGFLDTEHPTLIGYSQGAYRAEQLVGAYPERYPRALLGGPPTPPSYDALKSLSRVAVMGGELEDRAHMEAGTADLIAHGMRAQFFILPNVHHGSYGPQGRKVVERALSFIFEAAASD